MDRSQAFDILQRCKIDHRVRFHALHSTQVLALIKEADAVKYRAPKNANGSRGRYFHAWIMRAIAKGTDA